MFRDKEVIGNLEKSTFSGVGVKENQRRRNEDSEGHSSFKEFCYKGE